MSDRPYQGLRVLDMSQGVAGPSCGVMLGQNGAEVIKVEPPEGDWIRLMGGGRDGLTALAIVNNIGKRSICVDARQAAGRALIEKLAAKADVMIENFRPGVMQKLGLDYEALAKINPALIYLSVTGFGDAGPWVQKPGTDSVLQAFTGMAWLNREDSGKPKRMGMLVPDTISGLYATQAVGAALFARTRTGLGRHLKISLAECCAAFQSAPIVDDALFAGQSKPPVVVPSGVFATADGHMVLVSLRADMWARLCVALGREDWLQEPRYADNALRGQHAAEINQRVADILATRPTQDWIAIIEKADVLCTEVQDYAQLRAHPQMQAMAYFGELAQAPYDTLPLPYLPGTPRDSAPPPAPRAGQHTREILRELAFSETDLAELENTNIVVQGA